MKQAQVGQIIVYLLAIVIFAIVLIFGYKAVVNIRQKTDVASYLNFQKSLEADIKSIYFDYGSVKKVSYSVGGYDKVCFADLDKSFLNPSTCPSVPATCTPKIVENSITSKIKKNVFLVGDKLDSFYVDKKIEIPSGSNPKCIDIENGKLNIQLEGQGDSALVTQP